jgi:hypothetical protein
MAYLAPEAIDDLVQTNFNRMLKGRTWNDLSLTKQFYTMSDRFFRGKKMNLKGGPKVIWKLQVRNSGQARFIGTYEVDVHSRDNQMIGAECNWSIAQASYIYDTLEPDFQSGDMLLLVDHAWAMDQLHSAPII